MTILNLTIEIFINGVVVSEKIILSVILSLRPKYDDCSNACAVDSMNPYEKLLEKYEGLFKTIVNGMPYFMKERLIGLAWILIT